MRPDSVIAALCFGSVLAGSAASAQPATHTPDLSGMWGRNAFDFEALPSSPSPVTNSQHLPSGSGDPQRPIGDYRNPWLKPQAAQIVKQRAEKALAGDTFPDPSTRCAPYPPPFVAAMQLGLQMLQRRDEITILYNQDDQVRHVRLNASHPAHVAPSSKGDSVAHYEGDTLVIDTVGIKSGPLAVIDRYGTPFSGSLHVVERYRLIDAAAAKEAQLRHEGKAGRVGGPAGAMLLDDDYANGLQLELTIEDPAYFTAPLNARVTYRRTRLPWQEQVCAENAFEYYSGKQTDIPKAENVDF